MWRTLGEALPQLHENQGELEIGRVKKMLSAVNEMKSSSITPAELERAASEIEDEALKLKLQDLSFVYSLYQTTLQESYSDQGDDLIKLCEILRENRFFDGACVFIDAFTSFTSQEYALIAQIIKQCDVVVTLPLPKHSESKLCFEELFRCESTLKRLCAPYGIKVEDMGACRRSASPLLSYVASNLFYPSPESLEPYDGECEDSLFVVEAQSPYASAEYVASDIAKRVQAGARYKDFSIIARDASRYEGIIDSALKRYEIPYFMSVKSDISSYAAIKLIYSAYSVCASNFDRRDLITYIKCGLCGISEHDCDEFELYTARWNLSGAAFSGFEDWDMNPDGYTALNEEASETLARINETRKKLISPLIRLCDRCRGKHTVTEHCHALYDFLCELELEDKLHELGTELCRDGEDEDGEITLKLFSLICDALDALVQTLPQTTVNADAFIQLLRIAFGETNMGRIPASCDEVTVGSADMLRTEAKYVYLFSANDTEFPAIVRDSGIFSASDRELLSEAGITVENELFEQASRELFCFYRAFRSSSECVSVVYSLADESFSRAQRASVVSDILHLAGGAAHFVRYSDIDSGDRLWHKAAAMTSIGEEKDERKRSLIISALDSYPEYERALASVSRPISNTSDTLSEATMSKLYSSDISTTQSRIEKYAKCKFSYFCQYVLRLDENKKAKIDFAGMGSFVHAVLERLFAYLDSNGKHISEMTDDEISREVEKISASYIREISPAGKEHTPRMAHLFRRLNSAAHKIVQNLREEFSQSEFIPRFFEMPISEGEDACSSIEITTKSGTRIRLHGIIDRVDTYKQGENVYVRIVDYKSGAKRFSLDSIEKGLNLQMLIYLFSIWKTDNERFKEKLGCTENGEIIPAGILYMPTRIDNIKSESTDEEEIKKTVSRAFLRNGLLLEDEEVLRAMEKNLENRFIPVSLTKAGDLTPKSSLASLEKMGKLLEDTKEVISKICSELQSGDAKADPLEDKYSSPCSYCAMRAVCRRY
jgi:ATP-dependent helicase/nuclease subunit B